MNLRPTPFFKINFEIVYLHKDLDFLFVFKSFWCFRSWKMSNSPFWPAHLSHLSQKLSISWTLQALKITKNLGNTKKRNLTKWSNRWEHMTLNGCKIDKGFWKAFHSMLTFTWMPKKIFQADWMLLSIRKSWGIFPIQQKFNTMAAFVDSKNYYNQISLLKPKNEYHRAVSLQQKRKSAQW